MKRVAAIVVLLFVLVGCTGHKPRFYCDGTTGVYYKARALDAVPDHPACKEGTP